MTQPEVSESQVLSLKQARRWVSIGLGLVLLFNLVDLILTLLVVELGFAEEANPIMAALLDQGPVAFAIFKIGVVSLGVWVLHAHRHNTWAAMGTVAVASAYGLLMVWHSQSVRFLLGALG